MGAVSTSRGFDSRLRSCITIGIAFILVFGGSVTRSSDADSEASLCDTWFDLEVVDRERGRTLPIRIYLPESKTESGLILFSHGLGGSRRSFSYLAEAWAAQGFCTVFIQHPGSDEDILAGVAEERVAEVMREVAGRRNFTLRIADIPAVLDQLEEWTNDSEHRLHGRIGTERVGIAGHSFGAMTAQALGGQRFGFGIGRAHFADDRVAAALMLSPSPPISGTSRLAFGRVDTPWMLITGTEDYSKIAGVEAEQRRDVFRHLPAGGKYELVLMSAEHHSYDIDENCVSCDNERYRAVIAAVSSKFWKAWLGGDKSARDWLEGDGPTSLTERGDIWLVK